MKFSSRKIFLTVIFSVCICTSFLVQAEIKSPQNSTPPRPTKAINEFIDYMVKKHHFNRKNLTAIMDKAQYEPKVIYSITYPYEKKPWDFYRRYFLREDRIQKGVQYWNSHKKALQEIQAQYGVSPSVIIAIIGIESFYGKNAGTYNELNALSTLAFYYPKRAPFFKKELEHFLLLTRREGLSPLDIKGSYAGALGIPQFMPSTYRHYSVKYKEGKTVDLFSDHGDTIASIANYLKQSGWTAGKPVAIPAKIMNSLPEKMISQNAKPIYPLTTFEKHRILPVEKEPQQLKAALIVMENTDSKEYWLVFKNFYAIMKYNPRTTYSLAVFELSRAIENAHDKAENDQA